MQVLFRILHIMLSTVTLPFIMSERTEENWDESSLLCDAFICVETSGLCEGYCLSQKARASVVKNGFFFL